MSRNSLAGEAPDSTRRLEWSLDPAEEEDPGNDQHTLQVEPGNIPRVTRLMALAIHFDGMLRRGDVPDYATLARLGQVTRARMSQIMALLHLAPDIQEEILFLPRTVQGRDLITEHDLRPIAAIVDWHAQRETWRRLLQRRCGLPGRPGALCPEAVPSFVRSSHDGGESHEARAAAHVDGRGTAAVGGLS